MLISDKNTHPIEISTSTLVVNSTNALQYLYNADSAYSAGDGKLMNNNNRVISSLIQKYEERFELNNVQFYLKITPVRDNNPINTRPILTRLSSPSNANEIPLDLKILGEEKIGFEAKVKLQYENNNQEFTCDGAHQFYHQTTGGKWISYSFRCDFKGFKKWS